jgi:hypothetical protein
MDVAVQLRQWGGTDATSAQAVVAQHCMACCRCGEPLADVLARLGSLYCHDCRHVRGDVAAYANDGASKLTPGIAVS